jgi:acetyl esterase/lipase
MPHSLVRLLALLTLLAGAAVAQAQETDSFTRKKDVIYGRKYGVALTMDVFTPKEKTNGAGIIFCVSGGWFSSHDNINAGMYKEFLNRGYTVFAVVHGSQPKFNLEEILQDMNRAVRYIRYHAKDFHIDPNRLGITGGSAGGHLSLMQGVAGDKGDPKAKDPVDQTSSRVQAVACVFPPSDFLNWGEKGKLMLGTHPIVPVAGAFAFYEQDKTSRELVVITDQEKRKEIGRKVSPIYHISAESPPTLIVHGDQDKLVPLEQAERFIARLKEAGVPAELIVKPGGGHDGPTVQFAMPKIADWFDKYLKKSAG